MNNQSIRYLCIFLMLILICQINLFALSINHGPYLQEMSENGVTIMWLTDYPSYGSIEYGPKGSFTKKIEEIQNGILKISKLHKVRITGLTPGTEYNYRVSSTEVENYLPQFPTIGGTTTSTDNSFVTFDKNKSSVSFLCVTDIHGSTSDLIKFIGYTDWPETDFLAMTGDVLDDISAKDSAKIYSRVLDPCTDQFASESPFLFVRGNHEYRGSLAPLMSKYFPHSSGEWFYSFYQGPAYFYVFDSGEDKADNSEVLGGIDRCEPYRAMQKVWFAKHVKENSSLLAEFPVKIAFVHDPDWGYGANFDKIANDADLSLLISGHTHSYAHRKPGNGRDFHTLVVGRYQSAKVTVTTSPSETIVDVEVYDSDGNIYDSWNIVENGKVGIVSNQKPALINLSQTFKSYSGIISLPAQYRGLKKSISLYNLRGKLILNTTSENQIINIAKMKEKNGIAKGLSIVKINTIK